MREGLAEDPHVAACKSVNDVGLVLLRPDCLRSGKATALVDHLRRRYRLRVLGIRVLRLSARQLRTLYSRPTALWGETAWLHRELLTREPSAVVLLMARSPLYSDVWSLLDSIKGPSLAVARAPESLRQRFGRQSSFHSVIHCPGDRSSMKAAVRLFFGNSRAQKSEIPRSVWSVLLELEPRRGASVFEAAAHTARRMTAAAILRGTAAHGLLFRLGRLLDELKARSYPDQRETFLEFARRRERELRRIPDLPCLFGCRGLTAQRTARLLRRLERNNVPVSSELAGLLYAGALADLNPTAVWEDTRLYPYKRQKSP